MELRRYRKNYHLEPETVNAGAFVAFWAGDKYVHGLDRAGVVWLLTGGHTLKEIEANTTGLTRIHRRTLIRLPAIEHFGSLPCGGHRAVCTVGGREFLVSRQCRPKVQALHKAHVAAQGHTNGEAA
ncbi:LytTR family transcriptional regulator (plasmid) [Pseudomonas yamanorum]|nr:LytTR family transcriptional regulator [Pseudomonas yamanorum]